MLSSEKKNAKSHISKLLTVVLFLVPDERYCNWSLESETKLLGKNRSIIHTLIKTLNLI